MGTMTLETNPWFVVDDDKETNRRRTYSSPHAVGNFNTTDYRDILLFPAISGGLGYVAGGTAGAKVCMRTPTAVCAGGLGLVAGLMFAAQSSSARLMGFRNPE